MSKYQEIKRTEEQVDQVKHPDIERLQGIIGYEFSDKTLLEAAVTHCSVTADRDKTYERMEFLGDAVLGMLVAEYLYRSDNNYSEGEMTQIKSSVVSRKTLMYVGRELKLEEFLRVDNGLTKSASVSSSITSDAYEAIIGAIYLDSGIEAARAFMLRTITDELTDVEENKKTTGFKSLLQEKLQANGNPEPEYDITEVTGPAHDRRFKAEVTAMGKVCGSGWGRTKKDAEKAAAREAMAMLYPEIS